MIQHLIHRIISVIFLVSACSCCKLRDGQGQLQPEWETEIPTFESDGVYRDGLPNMPKYDDLLIAHTSIYHGGLFEVDNRLCAIDLKTGDAKWFFPSDIQNRRYCSFDDNGYLYKNKLLFQYGKDGCNMDNWNFRSTVCLDAQTGEILWEKDSETNDTASTNKVVGHEATAFFIQDSSTVVKVDLENNALVGFYHSDSLSFADMTLDEDYLAIFCRLHSNDRLNFKIYVTVLNVTTGNVVLPPMYICKDGAPPHGIVSGDVLYVNVDDYLVPINIRSGEKLWERSDDYWAHTYMDMFVYKDVVLKCGINATVAYDRKKGDILYEYRDYGSWQTSVDGRFAYLINRKQNVDIIDLETGEILDTIKCKYQSSGEDFSGSYPVIHDGKMYIMSYNHLFRYPIYPWK